MSNKKILSVPLIGQQTLEWCWAACTEMILKYMGHDVPQCQQANDLFKRSDCCDDPTPHECVEAGWPAFGHWGFSSKKTPDGGALTFDQLKAQIDANKPVAFAWKWPVMGGHMMLATGYSLAHDKWIHVNDPALPFLGDWNWITYDHYVKGLTHTHWRDYYAVTWEGSAASEGEPEEKKAAPGEPQPQEIMEPLASGAPGGIEHDSPEELALEALKLISVLAPPGFEVDDASQLTLGEPLAFHYIWHDALQSHEVGDDVDELLTDGQELLYPVSSHGEVISSIVVIRQEGGWILKSIGGPNLARGLTTVRDQHATASGCPHSDYVVIHLPHMYHIFVAHRKDARLMVTHIHDHEGYGFERHQTQPAHEVISTILPDAKVFKGALRL